MNKKILSNREQVLVATVILVFVLGIYVLFRFVPEYKDISGLEKQAAATQQRILTTRIPDEPEQNVEELLAQIDRQERSLTLQGLLAPFNSQELKVRISDLARRSGVRIQSNEPFITSATKTQSGAIRDKKKRPGKLKTNQEAIFVPASHGWIARMAPGSMFHRPLQRLRVEGNFSGLRNFIHALDSLPWQVTVTRIKIEKLPIPATAGIAQPLSAEMVLAL